MENGKHLFGYDSLAFFGRVNASISHELKNIMAIISETAGLLSDLSEMASTGSPVDPDMLKSSTDSIIEEIQRGFTTIRQMNRFAHSVDTPIVSVDLMELLDLVCHLSAYLAYSGEVRLAPWSGNPPLAQTCPFKLQALVYKIMTQHFKNAGPGVELDIAVRSLSDTGWGIAFAGLCIGDFQAFPEEQVKNIAVSIGVAIEWDRANDHLELRVPLAIQPDALGDDSAQQMDGGSGPSIRRKAT
jgi:signal transduction histidine kinase